MKKEMTYEIDIMRMANWDFKLATKLQKAKNSLGDEKFYLIKETCSAGEELAFGIVNEERLRLIEKTLNHFKKYKKQYLTLGTFVIIIVSSGALSFANPAIQCFAESSTKAAMVSSNMPSVDMGQISTMINKLIKNLITIGLSATAASSLFEMLKSIVEGNKSKLPKILITNGMMACCILISPSVFNFISKAFNMGNIIQIGSALNNILL